MGSAKPKVRLRHAEVSRMIASSFIRSPLRLDDHPTAFGLTMGTVSTLFVGYTTDEIGELTIVPDHLIAVG